MKIIRQTQFPLHTNDYSQKIIVQDTNVLKELDAGVLGDALQNHSNNVS